MLHHWCQWLLTLHNKSKELLNYIESALFTSQHEPWLHDLFMELIIVFVVFLSLLCCYSFFGHELSIVSERFWCFCAIQGMELTSAENDEETSTNTTTPSWRAFIHKIYEHVFKFSVTQGMKRNHFCVLRYQASQLVVNLWTHWVVSCLYSVRLFIDINKNYQRATVLCNSFTAWLVNYFVS